ncbi:MAG TPA: nitroreductase/quinone reductase family protein [Candidatus Dormibacteraeota bacterium]|nr:nitroreductase/quinone reductase family protein [Candidatus Dormibacteraeota bacterium]
MKLDEKVRAALVRGGVIDITTIGRRTGRPRRLEIVFHNIGGRIYISGMPFERRRSWLANLEAQPAFTFHLKGAVKADLPARARIIEDDSERRKVLAPIATFWKRKDLDRMVRQSPLVEVLLDGAAGDPDAMGTST